LPCGLCGFEFAIDADVGVLVETGIGFEARFGLGSAFEDAEIMLEEADVPLKAGTGGVMLEGMCEFLGCFDDLAVRYAGCRPGLGEMVGVELKDAAVARVRADNDMFLVFTSFLDGVHRSPEELDPVNRHEIAHPASGTRGDIRVGHMVGDDAAQTGKDACFQMSWHRL